MGTLPAIRYRIFGHRALLRLFLRSFCLAAGLSPQEGLKVCNMPVQVPMDPNRLYWASALAGPNPQRLRLPIDNPCGLSGSRRLRDRRQFGQQSTRNVLFHISPLVIF